MQQRNLFFKILKTDTKSAVQKFALSSDISMAKLNFYNNTNILPSGDDLDKICAAANITPTQLKLKMGILDGRIKTAIQKNADAIFELLRSDIEQIKTNPSKPNIMHKTDLGTLYQGDCIELMHTLENDSIDLIFADPPFNLKKIYPSNIDDNLKETQYLHWCESWLNECVRILKPGGSLFIWNLPKWNTFISSFLNDLLTFRNWISVDIKYSLPIAGRFYPSHYALLYYCKGKKPNTFKPDRLPMPVCPHCTGDLKDYGGYKSKMNPKGVNMTDVWLDIPPVRHAKYKKRNGANELSIKLLDRIIELSSNEGDVVFDPFGGSGTTYAVAEIKNRKWIGVELGPVNEIIDRLDNLDEEREYTKNIRKGYNCLITEKNLKLRQAKGLWTPDSIRKKQIENGSK